MKIDLQRYVPMGLNATGGRKLLLYALAAGCAWSFLLFVSSYMEAYNNLFSHYGFARTMLREGAMMPEFFEILAGTETLFILVCAMMPVWAAYHYYYHFSGSKSIYLMRRLPERWDLHRRCLALPAAGAAAALALQGLLGSLYYLIYILCTPRQCLPV